MAPGNALLSGFQLVRVGGTKYHYKFNFVHNAGVGDVIEKETQGNADGNGNVIYLDRHALKAPAGWGLKGFKLIRPTSGNIAYRYWIQKVVA